MSKNQIIKVTGIKNKWPILAAINLLVKDKILDSKKVNKQKGGNAPRLIPEEAISRITGRP